MLMPSIFGEDLFDDFFNDFTRPAKSVARYNTPTTSVMRTDVKETEGSYELDIDLPGYKKEDVQAQLRDGYMVITAKQQTQKQRKQHLYLLKVMAKINNLVIFVQQKLKD